MKIIKNPFQFIIVIPACFFLLCMAFAVPKKYDVRYKKNITYILPFWGHPDDIHVSSPVSLQNKLKLSHDYLGYTIKPKFMGIDMSVLFTELLASVVLGLFIWGCINIKNNTNKNSIYIAVIIATLSFLFLMIFALPKAYLTSEQVTYIFSIWEAPKENPGLLVKSKFVGINMSVLFGELLASFVLGLLVFGFIKSKNMGSTLSKIPLTHSWTK